MKILIPSFNAGLMHCVHSLKNEGFSFDVVIAVKALHNHDHAILIDELKKVISVDNIKIYNGHLNQTKSTQAEFIKFLEELILNERYSYIFPTIPEYLNYAVAELNSKFNLPGITKENIPYCSKKKYYETFRDIAIPVPEIYGYFKNELILTSKIVYPVVVKPAMGSGSIGVKIIFNEEELKKFFDVDKTIDTHAEYWKNGYFDFNDCYIIQEYVEGQVITLSGRIVDKKVKFDAVFDIMSSQPPWCSELSLSFPSTAASDILDSVYKRIEEFLSFINLNNSPFLFDVIVSSDKFYFIDFGMRISNNPQRPLHLIEQNYTGKWVRSLLLGTEYLSKFNRSVLYYNFNFPMGKILSIDCDKHLADEIDLPSTGKNIYPSRNDLLASDKGYFIIVDDSREKVNIRTNKLLNSLKIKYYDS